MAVTLLPQDRQLFDVIITHKTGFGACQSGRTDRTAPIGLIPRAGPDCLANSCTQASGNAECRDSEKRDGLF
jgi:hypothetical protein